MKPQTRYTTHHAASNDFVNGSVMCDVRQSNAANRSKDRKLEIRQTSTTATNISFSSYLHSRRVLRDV